jgi:hypothetical protein
MLCRSVWIADVLKDRSAFIELPDPEDGSNSLSKRALITKIHITHRATQVFKQ